MFAIGFSQIGTPEIIAWTLFSVVLGIIFGAVPGISTSMGIALMLPITFKMPLILSLGVILGLYVGGTSGGLISAILLNIPGTPSAIATCWDGNPMAVKGEAGRAIGIGVLCSFIGGIFSLLILMFSAPALARITLKFGAVEYFAVTLFSLTLVASLSGKDLAKGVVAAIIGLMLTTIGMSPIDGTLRYTLGNHQFDGGLQLLPVLVGLYAVAEILGVADSRERAAKMRFRPYTMHGFGMSLAEFKSQIGNITRSALIGTGIGILPGIGGGISNMIAYSTAKNQSNYPEKFGTGIIDGIAASETANNAVTGGALIPLLTVGIPGDAATALLLAAMLVQGVTPGPLMFRTGLDIVYAIFMLMMIANFAMVVFEMAGLKLYLKILKIPRYILMPIIMVLCTIGSYSTNNRVFDIWTILGVAIIGYVLQKFKYPIAPLVLGFILGPILEINFRRALMIANGDYSLFVTRPFSAAFLALTVASIIFFLIKSKNAQDMPG
jgi:putative tricarboxylic transport membrane protein